MKYRIIPVTPFQQNCTLLWCEETMEAVVVDPGGDLERILSVAKKEGVNIVKILLTHAHVDHVGGTGELSERLAIPIEGPHLDDKFWIDGLLEQCKMFGFPAVTLFQPDRWLIEGDEVTFGEESLEVIHCPGHTPGHVVFFHAGEHLALVGDVLFHGSIGRTDFPKGDHDQLIRSIQQKLFPLGDDVVFLPGHGDTSNFGEERQNNPFLSGRWG